MDARRSELTRSLWVEHRPCGAPRSMGVESRPTVIPLITLLLLFVVWIRILGDYASRPSRERRRARGCSEERPAQWLRHAAPAYSPDASASCAWPIARRRRRSSLAQSKMTFWECT